MKLPLLDALETVRTNERRPALENARVSVSATAEAMESHVVASDPQYLFKTTASFNFQQFAPESGVVVVQDRAKRAIMNGVYGTVAEEVSSILELLWQDGLHSHPVAKRLDDLYGRLRGQ